MSHRRGLQRITYHLRREGWAILQRAAAAVVAFVIARWIGDHPDVFFAPIAAIVSLNTDVGDRGLNALKLLLGVITGIIVGELALLVVGDQVVALGVAALIAIGLATIAGGSRLTIAQAAAAAVLTISVADGSTGLERLIDALVGAGVALIFTQVLFTPNPLRLLRLAEAEALTAVSRGLHSAADAMRDYDEAAGQTALADLRRTRDELAEIYDVRQRSRRVTRHTLTRRGSTQPVVAENENAGFLDLLGDGSVMAVRLGIHGDQEQQHRLSSSLRGFAKLLERLAGSPGDRKSRQQVVDDIPDLLDQLHGHNVEIEDPADTAARVTRMLAHDIMRYAGVGSESAQRVMEQDATEAKIPDQHEPQPWLDRLTQGTKSAVDRLRNTLRRNGQDQE